MSKMNLTLIRAQRFGVFLLHFTKKKDQYIAIEAQEGSTILMGTKEGLLSELERLGVEVKYPDIVPVILGQKVGASNE